MLTSVIVRTVEFCVRHLRLVILLAVVIAAGASAYTVIHFSINSNIDDLLSQNLPWRKREIAYHKAFPGSIQLILVVVDGPTPELTQAASRSLTQDLAQRTDIFRSVTDEGGGAFFRRNQLLYVPTDQLNGMTGALQHASPLIGTLQSDPSLRGLVQTLSLGLMGVQQHQLSLDAMQRPLNMAADTVENGLAGRRADFSWKVLLQGEAHPSQLRRFIAVLPNLKSGELQPAAHAMAVIHQSAADLKLASVDQARVRVTGPAPISEQQLASANRGVVRDSLITGGFVIVILWIALRSFRLVLAAIGTLAAGVVVTAAVGLLMTGALNPISVAFAVLFLGLGADFAIQYSMRYRAERHLNGDLMASLSGAAHRVGAPLTLAAGAAAAGFLSFLPTPYTGLAQLGEIAGVGMIIAYAMSMTLQPALIHGVRPPPEPHRLRQPRLAPVDRWLNRHRILIVACTAALVIAGLPALLVLKFDFNPLDLQKASSEPIATMRDLAQDPTSGLYAAQVLTHSPQEAAAVARKIAPLSEVAQVRTLDSFVPDDQDRRLATIQHAAHSLGPALSRPARPAPSDADNVASLRRGAADLWQAAGAAKGAGADAARRLARDLDELANSDEAHRAAVATAFVRPLKLALADLRDALKPERITRANLPASIVRDWVSPDGISRVEVAPKGDTNNEATLRRFAAAVLKVEPNATGQAISAVKWGDTIVWSFVEAGAVALVSIALLLWIVLRRFGDMLLTLIPLLVAAIATLEICGITGFALNYANIIALPVLLGVGVAFKIYYILAWRSGQTDFLESALTRAVFFSALFTATAFGSLWLSPDPGISTMGKLLAMSLACTLVSAVLFQPALMGEPRQAAQQRGQQPQASERAQRARPQSHEPLNGRRASQASAAVERRQRPGA